MKMFIYFSLLLLLLLAFGYVVYLNRSSGGVGANPRV
jgi:hypothetical protein